MKTSVRNVEDVARRHLCMGCGACAGAYPAHVKMVDTATHGRRPVCLTEEAKGGALAERIVRLCPGVQVEFPRRAPEPDAIGELFDEWGTVLEVWEGHAVDPELRYRGSSGGLGSALALFCVEAGGMDGVLHVRPRPGAPYLNESTISRTREEVLGGSGSRYGPSSPCDRLHELETAPGPSVVVGKPCDIAAVHRAAGQRPALSQKIGMTLSIFCAGLPRQPATFDLIEQLGTASPKDVVALRYRGEGWPGRMRVLERRSDGTTRSASLSYAQGWGDVLQKRREWRCHVCADHTGELADLSVGDPWYRRPEAGDPGQSLLLVRTPRGRQLVRDAVAAGVIAIRRRPSGTLPASQANLARTRGALWGRLAALRLLGAPSPSYRGLPLFPLWWRLTAGDKLRSVAGTVKRVLRRRLHRAERWAAL